MRLFGFGKDPEIQLAEEHAKARREASQANIEQGGLPLEAIDRLTEQASKQGTNRHFFTSDLSVNELSVVHQAGYEPLGQVMGSSVYHVGRQWGLGTSWGTQEMTVLSHAYSEARRLAFGRLLQEAALLGADGVVGVRLERKKAGWDSDLIEFIAIGTAVRGNARTNGNAAPFVSSLSGEDFWMLRKSGFTPVSFAFGNCSYACVSSYNRFSWVNQEITDLTQAVYEARGSAMQRMESEARAHKAENVVGVTIETEMEVIERDKMPPLTLIHFTAFGTGIASFKSASPSIPFQMAVSLG